MAPACAESAAREFAESEHATRQYFWTLAKRGEDLAPERVRELGVLIDELNRTLCDALFDAPLENVRAVLRRDREAHPKRVLTVVDLLALDAFRSPESLPKRLALVDALITLACTEGDSRQRVAPQDPVALTPVLRELARVAEAEFGEKQAELEAGFFNAANLAADVREPPALAELRARKAKLGRGYFAPGMLRAIVTYNMALEQARQPWVCTPETGDATESFAPPASGSVFASDALAGLHAALRERLAGKPLQKGPAHRIARALDVDALDPSCIAALDEGSLAAADLRCAIVLVGLLVRSLNVLGVELQEIGIDPDVVSSRWLEELDQLVKIEVNDSIMSTSSGAAYEEARALSDLRNRFLFDSTKAPDRKDRTRSAPEAAHAAKSESEERQTRKEARALASEAVSDDARPRAVRSERREIEWRIAVPALAIAALAVGVGLQHFGIIDVFGRGHDRWSQTDLAAVSDYLTQGKRNGEGAGTAFVGTVDERWLSLTPAERLTAAEALVSELAERGVSQVMIYDSDRRLRIQSLGDRIVTL